MNTCKCKELKQQLDLINNKIICIEYDNKKLKLENIELKLKNEKLKLEIVILKDKNQMDNTNKFIDNIKEELSPKNEILYNSETDDIIDFIPDYYVYADGACSNNGKDNAIAGIGIFFGVDDIRNVSKKIKGKQTNNTAELSAIIEIYYIIETDIINRKKITIVSDSEYAIRCYNKIWNKDIPNKELVKTVYELYKDKLNVKFVHIKAHTNNQDTHSLGNYNADKLANFAIGLKSCPYNK